MVVEVFAQHYVEHGQAYGGVGAGAQLDVVGRTRSEPGQARVYDDELAAALHQVHDGVPVESVGVRLQRAFAPEYDVLGHLVARVVVAVGEVRRVVELGIARAQQEVADNGSRAIARRTRHHERVIRSFEHGLSHRGCIFSSLASGSFGEIDCLRTIVSPYLAHFRLEDVERLVPRDALPLVLAAVFLGAFHGVFDAVGMIQKLAHIEAASTQTPLADGMVGIAFDLHKVALFVGVDEHAAANRMAPWRRPATRSRANEIPFFHPPFFIHRHRTLLSFPPSNDPWLHLRTQANENIVGRVG